MASMKNENLLPTFSGFYAGKTIVLTGGTGCVGQGVVEKLLRCCPNIRIVYLLIRPKRNQTAEERLQKLLKLPVFDVLRVKNDNFADQIACLPCNLQAEGLGLNEESLQVITEQADIFIHCAASVKFNEHLRASFLINVECVKQIASICRRMKNLVCFLHVSTAYSQCNESYIDETLYKCSTTYEQLSRLLEENSDEEIEEITNSLLDGRPNTYTFTKAMAEEVLINDCSDLPVCIVRPSIIIPACKEPLPGWCTNVYGPTGFMVGYAKGLACSLIGDRQAIADLIPVDLVVSCIVATVVHTSIRYQQHLIKTNSRSSDISLSSNEVIKWMNFPPQSDNDSHILPTTQRQAEEFEIKFYNIVSSSDNPITIGELERMIKHWYEKYPLDPIWVPSSGTNVTLGRIHHRFKVFFCQTIPAFMFDLVMIASMKQTKFRMTKHNNNLVLGMQMMEFFFCNTWKWNDSNSKELRSLLQSQDQAMFNFDSTSFLWDEQTCTYVKGTRQFIVKENMKSYPVARNYLSRLRMVDRALKIFFFLIMWRLLRKRTGDVLRMLRSLSKVLYYILMSKTTAVLARYLQT